MVKGALSVYVSCIAVIATVVSMGISQNVRALSTDVVITGVAAADTASLSHEFVVITNMGSADADVSGWTIVYQSASGGTPKKLATLQPTTTRSHLLLPARASEIFTSNEFAVTYKLSPFSTFTSGLSHTGGSVVLRNAAGVPIDQVGWGSAATGYETLPIAALTPTLGAIRIQADTDNNQNDFSLVAPASVMPAQYGTLYEIEDHCANLDGVQPIPPLGMIENSDGSCSEPDACVNLPGIQTNVPDGYASDEAGNCTALDICVNLDGVQLALPDGYEMQNGLCVVKFIAAPLRVTELLPNPAGVDTSNEFIEIYNDLQSAVTLDDYWLAMANVRYNFPLGSVIPAKSYMVFSDSQLKLTLPNTSGKSIELYARGDVKLDAVPTWSNTPEAQSWALIDGSWQFTDTPTPGYENRATTEVPVTATPTGTTQTPCGSDQFRNPETGRCKKIAVAATLTTCAADQERNPDTGRCRKITSTSELTPCKEGQYRSLDTNRCRNLVSATSSLTPCKEGQIRSLETNRCRSSTTAASTLKACAPDQERNPETNRCRKNGATTTGELKPCVANQVRNPATNRCKKAAATAGATKFAVEPVKTADKNFVGWWALGGVTLAGLGYAAYEWRREVLSAIVKITAFFISGR